MFPAPAGMSPSSELRTGCGTDVPRTCGDEPDGFRYVRVACSMFPAPAGMSL